MVEQTDALSAEDFGLPSSSDDESFVIEGAADTVFWTSDNYEIPVTITFDVTFDEAISGFKTEWRDEDGTVNTLT